MKLLFFFSQRAELNLPQIQAEARLKDDIKTTRTIAITIAAYFLCHVPTILYALVGLERGTLANIWFAFISWYTLYISSAVNPIIYYLRRRRCRSAFRQFLKDPFGSSGFKEKPHDRDSDRIESGVHGNQTRQKYPGKRRNALVILSIEDLATDISCRHEVPNNSGYGEGKAQTGGEAHASSRQVQNLYSGN